MNFVDEAKQHILLAVRSLAHIDLSKTPSFFFLSRLRDEMEEHGLHAWVEPTLGGIKLDIAGLGFDYEPHEEWLTDMAKAYAVVVKKAVDVYSTFGDEVVRNQLSNLSLKME